jgi:hypothetical protein
VEAEKSQDLQSESASWRASTDGLVLVQSETDSRPQKSQYFSFEGKIKKTTKPKNMFLVQRQPGRRNSLFLGRTSTFLLY